MLTLEAVSKTYGRQAILKQVSHNFESGLNVLVGPSGAGKSTLLRLCATVERPSSGKLYWDGRPFIRSRRALRNCLGYAPQIVDLPLDVTAMEFLAYISALKGLGRGAKEQAGKILEQLGLSADADRALMGWSGGMRRRLILAQALLGSPRLLILDEPTAELDSETAGRVADLIGHMAQSATILLTTHLSEHFQAQGGCVLRVANGHLSAS